MTHATWKPMAAALCLATLAVAARAGDHGASAGPLLPQYAQECASCHVAYPPRLLPATSWRTLMGRLDKHFGTDASLDAATTRQLSDWLASQAATDRRRTEDPPEQRITRSAWFQREHREVPADAWRRPAIKSAANCAACHPQADQGDFNEHRVRIPR